MRPLLECADKIGGQCYCLAPANPRAAVTALIWQGHETCDDTNKTDTDGCTNACQKAGCGDGIVQAGKEQCDDANIKPGDGCSATCKAEPVAIEVGANLACALSSTGKVSSPAWSTSTEAVDCWGSNSQGQLGIDFDENDITAKEAVAVPSVKLGGPAKSIVAGGACTCAVLESGDAKCWGQNAHGQLGQGTKVPVGDDPNEMGDNLPIVELEF